MQSESIKILNEVKFKLGMLNESLLENSYLAEHKIIIMPEEKANILEQSMSNYCELKDNSLNEYKTILGVPMKIANVDKIYVALDFEF